MFTVRKYYVYAIFGCVHFAHVPQNVLSHQDMSKSKKAWKDLEASDKNLVKHCSFSEKNILVVFIDKFDTAQVGNKTKVLFNRYLFWTLITLIIIRDNLRVFKYCVLENNFESFRE